MAEAPKRVRRGLRFRSVIGDEKALWEVGDPIGRGYYECVVVNEPLVIRGEEIPGDFAGRLEAFHSQDILSALRVDSLFGGYKPENYEPQTLVVND